MLLQNCSAKYFHLQEIHTERTGSDNFKIIKLNWVEVSELMEKLDSSRTSINYMGLNELRRMIIIFNDFDQNIAGSLMFCFWNMKTFS